MRLFLTAFLSAFLWLGVNAQNFPIDTETKLINYNAVEEADGNADAIYKKAHDWFFTYYKNPHNVVKKSENNHIEARARFKILNPADKKGVQTMGGIVLYSFTVDFKDGRYRYEITNITWKQNSKYPIERWMDKEAKSYQEKYEFYLTQVDKEINKTIEGLNQALKQKKKETNHDW